MDTDGQRVYTSTTDPTATSETDYFDTAAQWAEYWRKSDPTLPGLSGANGTGFETQPYPTGGSYTVKRGDNLTKIARRLCEEAGCMNPDISAFIDLIVQKNHIQNSNLIYTGQVLKY